MNTNTHQTPSARFPVVTCAVLAAALVVQCVPASAEPLEYHRQEILSGQCWRLWTGHLVHFTWSHWFYDAAALAILGTVCERRWGGRMMAMVLATAALGISLVLLAAQPRLIGYRGLSGLDSALFGWAAATLCVDGRRRGDRRLMILSALALAGFGLKLQHELTATGAVFADLGPGVTTVPIAHFAGIAIGLATALKRHRQEKQIKQWLDQLPKPVGTLGCGDRRRPGCTGSVWILVYGSPKMSPSSAAAMHRSSANSIRSRSQPSGEAVGGAYLPQQCLNFLPLPQGQGALRPGGRRCPAPPAPGRNRSYSAAGMPLRRAAAMALK